MRGAEDELDPSEDDEAADEASPPGSPPTVSKLKRNHIELTPSVTVRSRGANQFGRKTFGQRIPDDDGDTFHLVVQCQSVWSFPGITHQSFGLAVALWEGLRPRPDLTMRSGSHCLP